MQEKTAWARESLCLEWWAVLKEGVNQNPSPLTTWEGRKRWFPSSIGSCEGGVLWLEGRQWTSSALGTEQDRPMSRPLAAMVEKRLF